MILKLNDFIYCLAKDDAVYAKLTKAAKENGHFKVYNQKNIPARWHVNNTRRLGPILVVADSGYGFQDLMANAIVYEKEYNIPSKCRFFTAIVNFCVQFLHFF